MCVFICSGIKSSYSPSVLETMANNKGSLGSAPILNANTFHLLNLFMRHANSIDEREKQTIRSEFFERLYPELLIHLCNMRWETRFPTIPFFMQLERAKQMSQNLDQMVDQIVRNDDWRTVFDNIRRSASKTNHAQQMLGIADALVETLVRLEDQQPGLDINFFYDNIDRLHTDYLDDILERTNRLKDLTSQNIEYKERIKLLETENRYLRSTRDSDLLDEIRKDWT